MEYLQTFLGSNNNQLTNINDLQYVESMFKNTNANPDVSGWDGYRSWINTYTLPYRKLFANQVVDGYDGILPEWDSISAFAEKFDVSNPEVLIHNIINYLFAIKPSEQTQSLLLDELLDGTSMEEWDLYAEGSQQRLKDVVKHMMRLEEFQLR